MLHRKYRPYDIGHMMSIIYDVYGILYVGYFWLMNIIWSISFRSIWDQLIFNLKVYLIPKYDLLSIPKESFDKLKIHCFIQSHQWFMVNRPRGPYQPIIQGTKHQTDTVQGNCQDKLIQIHVGEIPCIQVCSSYVYEIYYLYSHYMLFWHQ